MKNKTVIYSWPQSQDCAECEHGESILTGNMDYICGANFKKPLKGECPLKTPKEEING